MSNSKVSDNLIEVRRDYNADSLSRQQLAESPFQQFTRWLQDARDKNILDATAMTLATSDNAGQPHARIVLLKNFDNNGFVWYTYQLSDKAGQLEDNPKASLLFYWGALERQVRVEGTVNKLDPSEADEYFYSRPEGSRFSAAASVQSKPIENRKILAARVAQLHQQHPDGNVPRPAAWGGYRLAPHRLEFWQGRADRLHDRFIYERGADAGASTSSWTIFRVQP